MSISSRYLKNAEKQGIFKGILSLLFQIFLLIMMNTALKLINFGVDEWVDKNDTKVDRCICAVSP